MRHTGRDHGVGITLMSVRTADEKQVNVRASYVEASVGYDEITFEIHDIWKEDRKRDPVYVMKMDLEQAQYMLIRLARAWVELKDKKVKRLGEQHRSVRSSVESKDE